MSNYPTDEECLLFLKTINAFHGSFAWIQASTVTQKAELNEDRAVDIAARLYDLGHLGLKSPRQNGDKVIDIICQLLPSGSAVANRKAPLESTLPLLTSVTQNIYQGSATILGNAITSNTQANIQQIQDVFNRLEKTISTLQSNEADQARLLATTLKANIETLYQIAEQVKQKPNWLKEHIVEIANLVVAVGSLLGK